MQARRSGFTLIELLVVIAIIGLLATLAVAAFGSARAKARDSKRLADMITLTKALELYKDATNSYPASDGAGCGGWDTPGNGTFISALKDQGLLSRDLADPNNNYDCGNYRYYRYPAGSYGCPAEKGDFYILQAVAFENYTTAQLAKPGFACSGRDWGLEGAWVGGKFTLN